MLTSFCNLWFAHSPTPGLGSFWNGVFHPILDLEQGIALLAVGMACAREEIALERRNQIAILATLAVVAFLASGLSRIVLPFRGTSLLLAGVMLIRPPQFLAPWLLIPSVLVGWSVSIGIAEDMAQSNEPAIFALGFLLSCFAILTYTHIGWHRFQRPWLVITSRILGSWLLAIGFMLLAGQLSGTLGRT